MATYHYEMTFSLRDANNAKASMVTLWRADGASTVQNIVDDVQAFAEYVNACTGATIESASFTISPILTDMKLTPYSGCDVNQTMSLTFRQESNPFLYSVVVPAVDDGLIVGGKIDLTAERLTNLISGCQYLTYSRGVGKEHGGLRGFIGALLSWRKRRKETSRRSFPV